MFCAHFCCCFFFEKCSQIQKNRNTDTESECKVSGMLFIADMIMLLENLLNGLKNAPMNKTDSVNNRTKWQTWIWTTITITIHTLLFISKIYIHEKWQNQTTSPCFYVCFQNFMFEKYQQRFYFSILCIWIAVWMCFCWNNNKIKTKC